MQLLPVLFYMVLSASLFYASFIVSYSFLLRVCTDSFCSILETQRVKFNNNNMTF